MCDVRACMRAGGRVRVGGWVWVRVWACARACAHARVHVRVCACAFVHTCVSFQKFYSNYT